MGMFFKGSMLLTRWTWAVLLGLSLGACGPSKKIKESSMESDEDDSFIIGGKYVEPNNPIAKHVVLLANVVTQEVCTASLVGGPFAVTAAHCLDLDNLQNHVVVFNHKISKRMVVSAQALSYWKTRQNETYDSGDLAVIRFEGGLPEGFEAVEFLPNTHPLVTGENVTVAGYGVSQALTRAGAGFLRETSLKIANVHFSRTEILLEQTSQTGVCHGDSGGPAYIYINKKPYLWGVAIRGVEDPQDLCNTYVAYTNVLMYQVWIMNTMRTLPGKR